MTTPVSIPGFSGPIEEMAAWLRDITCLQTPEDWIRASRPRLYETVGARGHALISRRGLDSGQYRIINADLLPLRNPWEDAADLPVYTGGFFADLVYSEKAQIIERLHLSPDDPGAPFAAGMRSALSLPQFEQCNAPTTIVLFRPDPCGFCHEHISLALAICNLFNRGSQALVLREQLNRAYDALDDELKVVADIQRSLLPAQLPHIPTLDLAAHYETSERAGGDYYDIFPLADGTWAILLADASGHGTPAAVLMAIMHSLVHAFPVTSSPGELLTFLNQRMAEYYSHRGSFATAFHAIYNPVSHTLEYSVAGHPPPRLRRAATGAVESLCGSSGPPLGVDPTANFPRGTTRLELGDQLLLYTDGVTEARAPDREMFDIPRLDAILACPHETARSIVANILRDLRTFTASAPPSDDRTLLALRIIS